MIRTRAGATTAATLVACGALFSRSLPARAAEPVTIAFGEVLSDFTGPVKVGEARVAIDPSNREVFVGEARSIRVFDPGGMQVYEFQIAGNLGAVRDLAVLPDGSIVTLAYDQEAPGDKPRFVLSRHDYRGVPIGEIELKGLPDEVSGLLPNRMIRRDDKLIIASTLQLLAAEVALDGTVLRGWDLGRLLGVPDGFAVDRDGSLLATVSVMFKAFRISPEGRVESWGKPGSVAGTFGIAAGISPDGRGGYLVADKSRAVILVFDQNLRFLFEFGQDPAGGLRLGRPSDVFADGAGRIYVTQGGKAGVWGYDVRGPKN
jgi:hypothetical protein